jgi:type I restriction enzyme S subunit
MDEKSLKPQLRFKEFTDAWEQRKLGDFGSVCMNKRIFKNQTSENDEIPFYKIGTFGGKADAFISRSLFEEYKSKYPYPVCGDILISASGSIGRTVEYQGAEEYFQDSNIVWLNHRNTIHNPFLKYFYAVVKWNGIEGSTIKRLYNENILNTQITLPQKPEQQKIGTFFSNLDNLITLHQRKLDKLSNVKKALLEKMFPKNDSDVPEIRFKGFTDAWEQRKFDEVISRIATGLNPRDNFKLNSGGTNYYVTIKNFEHGHLHLDENCDKIDDTALKQIQERSDLQKDDILFSSIGRVGDCYLIESKPKNWNINESVFTLRPNKAAVNPLYMFHTIHADCVLSYILNNVTGSTFKSIKISDLKKAIIPLPNKEEQKKLGIFLSKLDNLITLHQRKLEKLKNIKKACLEKMFV